MKLPSKIASYSESVLSKFSLILAELQNSDMSVFSLYELTEKYFTDIEEFLDSLDCLFALNRILYDKDREVLCYVV